MSVDIPDRADNAAPSAEEPGFTDEAFDARYNGKPAHLHGSAAAADAPAPRPTPQTNPAAPRSRNSFMRARARRLAAASR